MGTHTATATILLPIYEVTVNPLARLGAKTLGLNAMGFA
jgi:hypothetical protein